MLLLIISLYYVELYSRSSKFIIQNGIIGERTEKILRLVFA